MRRAALLASALVLAACTTETVTYTEVPMPTAKPAYATSARPGGQRLMTVDRLYAWCERQGDGPRFTLHVEPAPPGIASSDALISASALNAGIEALVRRAPAQYQWTYKRWSQQPEGSPLGNPYWPDCY